MSLNCVSQKEFLLELQDLGNKSPIVRPETGVAFTSLRFRHLQVVNFNRFGDLHL